MARLSREPQRNASRRRPPPNYFSRRVQLRLLVLVALLMSVVVLLPKAADPDSYWWMGFDKNGAAPGESAPAANSANAGSAEVADVEDAAEPDTRISPENLASSPFESRPVEVSPESLTAEEPRDPIYLAKKDAWNELLAYATRSRLDLIARALRSLRHGEPLGQDDRIEWQATLEHFDERWSKRLQQARAAVAALPPSEQAGWTEVLARVETDWNERLEPALRVALEDRKPTTEEAQQIGELQALLDRLALARVVDDKPYQAVERDAWFRLLEMLQYSQPEQLQQQSIGTVGYLQLYRQSNEYRGKLVTIRGRVRQAYRVDAPANDFGFESYRVFWVRPEGGVNSPVAVYALEAPAGFPELGPQPDADAAPIDEQVEITGFFLKRWAYPAKDGARTAPLLLAKAPRWEQRPAETSPWYTSGLLVALCAGGAVLVAVGVSVYAFWTSSSKGSPPPYQARESDLKALEKVETDPTVEQSLHRLAQERDPP